MEEDVHLFTEEILNVFIDDKSVLRNLIAIFFDILWEIEPDDDVAADATFTQRDAEHAVKELSFVDTQDKYRDRLGFKEIHTLLMLATSPDYERVDLIRLS